MSNVHAMLGSIVSCMLTIAGTMTVHDVINPETIKVPKIERYSVLQLKNGILPSNTRFHEASHTICSP